MKPYNSRDGLQKYMVRDILDSKWCRRSNSIKYMIKISEQRRKDNPDSVLQLYRFTNGIYYPLDLPGDSKNRKANCTRNGIVCGHRRRLISANKSTCCMYILDTGKKRGCRLGRECTKYTTEICHERDDLFSDY